MSGKRPGDDFLEGSDFDFENPGNGSDSPRPPEGGDGTDFDFEMMPNPSGGADAPPARATVLPPPGDDDFDDEVVEEFPVAGTPARAQRDDDFGGDDNDFGGFESDMETEPTRRGSSRGAEVDAFDDAPVEEQVEDVVEEDEVDGDQETGAAGGGSPLVKYGIYGAIGLVGVAAIFYGWTSVLAPLLGMNAAIDQAPVIAQPISIIDEQPAGNGQPVIPGLGGTVPDQFATQPSLPGSPDVSLSSNDGPDLPGLPDAQGQVTPLDQGSEAGLLPVQGPAPVGVDADLVGRVDELEKELAALSREDLIQKVASLEARVEAIEAQPVNAGTPQPSVTPPVKPQVIENWALRGYTNGVAWVEGPAGFLEVRIGSTIPDVGEVTNIQQYEGNWLVVTDAGLIMQTAQ